MNIKLAVKDLVFRYDTRPILRGMNLEVPPGEFVSLIGPNGSGKSTFLKCIDRILKPECGDILVDEEDISSLTRMELARTLAYVPQSSIRVFPHTVFDIILMGRRPYLGWGSSSKDEEKAWDIISLLGLEGIAMSSFTDLSGGQQQKVLIGRALVQETDIMLLDEPTSNLDIWHQLDVMNIVSMLVHRHNLTSLMAVHDLNMAARYSDQVIMMKKGAIFAAGKPVDILTPENIAEVYGVTAEVEIHSGIPRIMLLDQLDIYS